MYRKFCCANRGAVGSEPAPAAGNVKELVQNIEELDSTETKKNSSTSTKEKSTQAAKPNQTTVPQEEKQLKDDHQKSKASVAMATVETAWQIIEQQTKIELSRRQMIDEIDESELKPVSGWKTIRVFVSSTFTDMHSEREILIKKVFPELREWCEERKFTVVDCDLRWGVPKDSTSRTTICTCLEEIDRCYEDNEDLPFFVSILGDRYGWIPTDAEVPDDVEDKYQWVPQVSITHMEILHGAYRFNNPNAVFCLRNPSYVDGLPVDKRNRFVDEEELNQQHLKALKEHLKIRFPQQVFEYNCQVDGIDMSTGREKVNIVGLETFAEKILEFLKEAINRQYPNHQSSPELSPSDIENNAHLIAMQIKSQFFVGREDELHSLLTYVKTGNSHSLRRPEEVKEEELKSECEKFGVQSEDSRIVCVIGEPGIGKSCLLANLAKTAAQDGLNVLYHSVGASDSSTTADGIVQRITDAIAPSNSKPEEGQEQEQEQEEKGLEKMKRALAVAASNEQQLLIVIDGLDETAENDTVQFLNWLPPRFPGNLRCVLSSSANHRPCVARNESRDPYFLDLELLTTDGAASMVNYYLHRFNKRLDPGQLSDLLGHKSSGLPLWLSITCEELRVFGDFATVSAKIKNFPDNLIELIKDVLKRLVREDETSAMEKVLSWINCSQTGLPEKIILSLLGDLEKKEEAPMVTWATVRRHLKQFILATGESQSLKVRFIHSSMNQAVGELLLSEESRLIQCHTYLADFYQNHCATDWLTINELPHHLTHAKLGARLLDFYRKDARTAQINVYSRSQALNKFRCQGFTHGATDPGSGIYLCTMCSFSSRLLSPCSPSTKDSCAICGNWVPFKNDKNIARLCMRHKKFMSSQANCLACGRMIFLAQLQSPHQQPMQLCTYCSFGYSRCAHLEI